MLPLCRPTVDDLISFERFVAELEDPLSAIHLDIKTTRDQETGEAYVSLVSLKVLHSLLTVQLTCLLQINTVSDAVAKLATDYSAVEIAHFRAIVRRSLEVQGASQAHQGLSTD